MKTELRGTLLLLAGLLLLSFSDSATAKVVTLIDAYTPTSVLVSPATVPLGTTVVLVCRVGGVASGTQLNYTWTCPNGPCNLGTGLGAFHNRQMYKDRMVINTMSPADSGRYSCRVAGDSGKILSRKSFNLTVINDLFLFSNQRFIPDNAIITSMDTIGTPQGGAISCYSPLQSGSPAWSGPPGVNLTTLPHPESEGTVSLVVGKRNFTNGQYCCQGGGGSRCVHLYTSGVGTLPKPRFNALVDHNRQWALIATLQAVQNAKWFVVAYGRQDLGVSLGVEYVRSISSTEDHIISKPPNTTVSGVKYSISVWALNGEDYSTEPFQHKVVLRDDTVPSAPRSPVVIRTIPDTYEVSWIPPQEPHGAVQYTVKYTNTHNMTEERINTTGEYCKLTGIIPGGTYRITVAAMNSVGLGTESEAVLFTAAQSGTPPDLGTGQPTPTTSLIGTGGIIISVVLVVFLLVLVGGTTTVVLLLVLLSVKYRRSKKKTKWALPRDNSLYSAVDYSYDTVCSKTYSVSTSGNIYDTVDEVSIKEPLKSFGVTQDPIRESTAANRMPLDSTCVPSDADGSEGDYQELVESGIQQSQYANLYSSIPLRKEGTPNPSPQNVVEVAETDQVEEDMDEGERVKQEDPYNSAPTVAVQVLK